MAEKGGAGGPATAPDYRWMARAALAATGASITLMVVLGVRSGSLAPAPPWPPWFLHGHPSPGAWSAMLWLAELLGAGGLALGLVAVRRGWRPRARYLILASVVAVTALLVIPPVDSADPVMYAAFGRIAVLGHSPYVMTPGQLRSAGDPVGAVVQSTYWNLPSRYGPAATATEAAASELGGTSAARAIFWMKAWNALAYLTLALALDRAARSDPARRARAHLLWSLNPLMLLALMANGHNDALAAAAGTTAILALRRATTRRALLAGILLGLATALKAQYALLGAGLAWTARRSPRAAHRPGPRRRRHPGPRLPPGRPRRDLRHRRPHRRRDLRPVVRCGQDSRLAARHHPDQHPGPDRLRGPGPGPAVAPAGRPARLPGRADRAGPGPRPARPVPHPDRLV